jgi:hypothetical protein
MSGKADSDSRSSNGGKIDRWKRAYDKLKQDPKGEKLLEKVP